MNPEDKLLKEGVVIEVKGRRVRKFANEQQLERLFQYNRRTIFEENRKLNIKRTPIEIV